jgi:hypothetical protein
LATVFLHIGKTGGTAFRRALRPYAERHGLKLVGHPVSLMDVTSPDGAVFSVREPIERYVSGFNTRLRKGFPRRVGSDWEREEERRAFALFQSPNSLAEALSDPVLGDAAREAMGGIGHVRHSLKKWLKSVDYLAGRAGDIRMICSTPELDADFEHVKRLLGLPPEITLPRDEIGTHKTPDGFERHLSPLAVKNLTAWYADDFPIYEACLALRQKLLAMG